LKRWARDSDTCKRVHRGWDGIRERDTKIKGSAPWPRGLCGSKGFVFVRLHVVFLGRQGRKNAYEGSTVNSLICIRCCLHITGGSTECYIGGDISEPRSRSVSNAGIGIVEGDPTPLLERRRRQGRNRIPARKKVRAEATGGSGRIAGATGTTGLAVRIGLGKHDVPEFMGKNCKNFRIFQPV